MNLILQIGIQETKTGENWRKTTLLMDNIDKNDKMSICI